MKDTLNKTEIGQRIRQLRILNDFTQAEFAESVDISVNFLSEIENGKKGLSGETLAKICLSLNTTADYIIFDKQSKNRSLLEIANTLSVDELETTVRYLQTLIEMKQIF